MVHVDWHCKCDLEDKREFHTVTFEIDKTEDGGYYEAILLSTLEGLKKHAQEYRSEI